jgi:hypothetical protein
MPAGTSTLTVRVTTSRPRPSHRVQGSSATLPSPPQTSHVTVRATWPNAVRLTACRMPLPAQRSHVVIGVPGSAPFPWQRSQRSTASY